jgi:hypothetical protein
MLYVAVAAALGVGALGAWGAETEAERQLVAGLMGLAAWVVMAVWVGRNRVPLSRLEEPATGAFRVAVRVVRSRRGPGPGEGRIARLGPRDPLPRVPGS